MRFQCADDLVVLRSCAPKRQYWLLPLPTFFYSWKCQHF